MILESSGGAAGSEPNCLALDFDGVVCNGLREYFQTAWAAYCQLRSLGEATPPAGLAAQFYPLRPVVESGWEMPVLLHALEIGRSPAEILDHWGTIAQDLAGTFHRVPKEIAAIVDGVRDAWIQKDPASWLAQHEFYPGVIDRLKQVLNSPVEVFIITTKEGRFVKQLLQQAEVDLPPSNIIGKEAQRPKTQTLQMLLADRPDRQIWFVEDRLKTLQAVRRQPELAAVNLFLAEWGYNTEVDRQQAGQNSAMANLTLTQFAADFSHWLERT